MIDPEIVDPLNIICISDLNQKHGPYRIDHAYECFYLEDDWAINSFYPSMYHTWVDKDYL